MISHQNARDCGFFMLLLICFVTSSGSVQAQTSAPGLLQPAYMPGAKHAKCIHAQ